MAPKSPSEMCACSCRGCSAKAKGGYVPDVLDNKLITFRNGVERLRRYYIQGTNHFTQIQDVYMAVKNIPTWDPKIFSLLGHVIFSLPLHVIFSFGE